MCHSRSPIVAIMWNQALPSATIKMKLQQAIVLPRQHILYLPSYPYYPLQLEISLSCFPLDIIQNRHVEILADLIKALDPL